MRLYLAIVFALVVAGCQSPYVSRDETARVASSLERRISDEEARHIAFDDIDHSIRAAQSKASDPTELDVLAKHRQRLGSRLESFLSRFRSEDQLWVYRTYVTGSQRGGESGFALVRDGAVVEHMGIMIYD